MVTLGLVLLAVFGGAVIAALLAPNGKRKRKRKRKLKNDEFMPDLPLPRDYEPPQFVQPPIPWGDKLPVIHPALRIDAEKLRDNGMPLTWISGRWVTGHIVPSGYKESAFPSRSGWGEM